MKNSKPIICMCVLFFLLAIASLGAEQPAFSADFSKSSPSSGEYGDWTVINGRLVQEDTEAHLAKINFKVHQQGLMEYSFDVSYVDGGLVDRMGGFGVHVFVDKAFNGESWGNGNSYLLWMNYDEDASYGEPGFRAQVYRSYGPTSMVLLDGYDFEMDPRILAVKDMKITVPIRMTIDADTGLVKLLNPAAKGMYWSFPLPSAPGSGEYISFRTNSLSVAFDNLMVRRLK